MAGYRLRTFSKGSGRSGIGEGWRELEGWEWQKRERGDDGKDKSTATSWKWLWVPLTGEWLFFYFPFYFFWWHVSQSDIKEERGPLRRWGCWSWWWSVFFLSLFCIIFRSSAAQMEPSRKRPTTGRGAEERRGEEGRKGGETDCLPGVSSSLCRLTAPSAGCSRLSAASTCACCYPSAFAPPVIGQVGASPSESCLSLRTSCLTRNSWTLITADWLTDGRNLLPASADSPQGVFLAHLPISLEGILPKLLDCEGHQSLLESFWKAVYFGYFCKTFFFVCDAAMLTLYSCPSFGLNSTFWTKFSQGEETVFVWTQRLVLSDRQKAVKW